MMRTPDFVIEFGVLAHPVFTLAQAPHLRSDQAEFRSLYQELVETDASARM
jgi:hypothetical protein